MARYCVVCANKIPTLFMAQYKDQQGNWLCTCSMCGGPMHPECFTRFQLDNKIAAEVAKVREIGQKRVTGFDQGYYLCSRCFNYVMQPFFEERVNFYEKTKRLEELALLYEAYDYLELAGATRERMRGHTVRNIHIDLNSLLEMMHRKGLSAGYKCPNCGAPMTIGSGTNAEGLKFCGYCGGALNTELIADTIQRALG